MSNIPRPKNSFMIWSSAYRKVITSDYNKIHCNQETISTKKYQKYNYLLSLLNYNTNLYEKVIGENNINFLQKNVPNNIISVMLGVIWGEIIDQKTKQIYTDLSLKEKNIHNRLYPNYKYTPKKKNLDIDVQKAKKAQKAQKAKKAQKKIKLLSSTSNSNLKIEDKIVYVDYGPDFMEFAYV